MLTWTYNTQRVISIIIIDYVNNPLNIKVIINSLGGKFDSVTFSSMNPDLTIFHSKS